MFLIIFAIVITAMVLLGIFADAYLSNRGWRKEPLGDYDEDSLYVKGDYKTAIALRALYWELTKF